MNIFSTMDGGPYNLSREKYLEVTQKLPPYIQRKNNKEQYFAVCPACGNPIQIVSLFGPEYEEQVTGRRSMHGRHYKKSICDLAVYNQARYDACPIHNPHAFHLVDIREDETENEEIRHIVEHNMARIANDIRTLTGVRFTNKNLFGVISRYINSRHYCYVHTNRFNLPYSILYTTGAINLFMQKLDSSGTGQDIADAINERSNHFRIESGQIKQDTKGYAELFLSVVKHRVEQNNQYITVCIIETYKDVKATLMSREFEVKQFAYEER